MSPAGAVNLSLVSKGLPLELPMLSAEDSPPTLGFGYGPYIVYLAQDHFPMGN